MSRIVSAWLVALLGAFQAGTRVQIHQGTHDFRATRPGSHRDIARSRAQAHESVPVTRTDAEIQEVGRFNPDVARNTGCHVVNLLHRASRSPAGPLRVAGADRKGPILGPATNNIVAQDARG